VITASGAGSNGIGQGHVGAVTLEASVAGPSFHWSLTGWPFAFQASWWLLECSALARRGGTPILGDTRAAILTNWLGIFPSSVSQQAQIVLVAPLTGTDKMCSGAGASVGQTYSRGGSGTDAKVFRLIE